MVRLQHLAAVLTTAAVGVGLVTPAAAATGTVTLSTTRVVAAPDFATERYADPWDMSNAADLSPHATVAGSRVSQTRLADGVYHADAARGGWLTFVGAIGGDLPYGRDGRAIPIDADRYTHLSVRMWSSRAETAQLWWFSCTDPVPQCSGAMQLSVQPGWQQYDLPIVRLAGQDVSWAGRLIGVRLVPAATTGSTVRLDHVRLYRPTAENRVTLRRSGGSGTGDVVVAPADAAGAVTGDATPVRVATNGSTLRVAANGSVTVDTSALPQGTWRVGVRDSAGVTWAPGPFTVEGPPQPVVLQPDVAGGADVTQVVGNGDRWDFSQMSDVASHRNVADLRIVDGVLHGRNAAPNPGDNQLELRRIPPFDGTRFHRLTLKIGYDGPFGLADAPGGGMMTRLIWTVEGSTAHQDLNDVVVRPGNQTISLSLRSDPPSHITDENTRTRIGWQGRRITSLRFDPNEDPGLRTWRVNDIRIAEDDRGIGHFDIQFRDRNWAHGTVADIYVDRGSPGRNRMAVATGVPVTSGVNTYRWALGSMLEGEYWPHVVLRRGAATGSAQATGPVQMQVQPAFGRVEVAAQAPGTPGTLRVRGWAIDPSAAGGTTAVHVYVDGRLAAAVDATRNRPDVAAAHPYGPEHGYDVRVGDLAVGNRRVCVHAFRSGATSNPLLGCRTVTIGVNPRGAWDATTSVTGGLRVTGWTLDPNTAEPTDVHVYVDGRLAARGRADRSRTDVAKLFPFHGAGRGYLVDVPLRAGSYRMCVYALDRVAPGRSALLACRDVRR